MALTTILLFVLFLILLLFFVKRLSRPKCTVPKGPRGHWLLGNMRVPFERHAALMLEWKRDYGPIYVYDFVPTMGMVVINDVEMAKKFFADKDFAGRDVTETVFRRCLNPTLAGIANQPWSQTWRDLRKFVMSSLSSLGFGRSRMETKVLAEADALVDAMLRTSGEAFDPGDLLPIAINNVIANVVFSSRTEIGQASRTFDCVKTFSEGFLYLFTQPAYLFFPFLTDVYRTKPLKRVLDMKGFMVQFVAESIAFHEATVDPDEPRDLVDVIVLERRRNPGAEFLSDVSVLHTVVDLFLGGTDTTATMLKWIIAWLLKYPEIRLKLLSEIESVFGRDGVPNLASVSSMNYLQAFVDEALRKSSVLDFSAPHAALEPVGHFAGYDIPRNVNVTVNIYGCHHDPEVWDEPNAFRPERFLDADGKYVKNENLMPFGLGTRRCVGEKLARLEIFLFTVRMLQRVELRLADGCQMPAMEGRKPFTRAPEIYQVVACPAG